MAMPDINEIFKFMTVSHHELTDENRNLVQRAYDFAAKYHSEKRRLSGEPYFNHVFAAGVNAARFGMDSTTVAAAILHDVIEDTEATAEIVTAEFGPEITMLVQGVTKLGKLKYRGSERHVESLRKFFVAVAEDLRVVVIKLADRLHNLQTLEHVRPDKQKRIALESIEIYSQLASRLGMGKLAGEIQDLAFPYAYPKEYEDVQKLLKTRRKHDSKYIEKVYRGLKREMAEYGIKDCSTHYRIKGVYSLYRKLKRKEMNIDEVHDIIALRVIVPSIEDCYRVLGLIHTKWRPLPGRIKDYIAAPKPNGYQSLHTTIFTGDGGIAEIQIRTPEMHDIAEYGIASHYMYKNHKYGGFDWIEQIKNIETTGKNTDFIKYLKTDFFSDRIFVFTPEGDVVDLPQGATVVDFAYAIHSDIGNHVAGAHINDKYSALKTPLNNGDRIQIVTNEKSHPTSKWLEYAKTTMAQKRVRSYLRQNGGSWTKWFRRGDGEQSNKNEQ